MSAYLYVTLCLSLFLFGVVFGQNKLVFSDDFDKFDLSVWSHEITMGGGGNWEFEWYTNNRTNSYVSNSILYLKPTYTANTIGEQNLENGFTMDVWGSTPPNLCTGNAFYGCSRTSGGGGNYINPIQSAAIRTSDAFSFTYGRVEIRAKLPCGDWIWPALWMMPRYNAFGDWPASGEIDIVESRGNRNYPTSGANSFASTLHLGPAWNADLWQPNHQQYTLPGGSMFCDQFHVFGLIWNQNGIQTYVDSQSNIVLNVKFDEPWYSKGGWAGTTWYNPWMNGSNATPFDQPYYLVFNVAVGGTNGYFPDGVGGKPWTDTSAHAANDFWNARGSWQPTWQGDSIALQVDWVRVYQ